MGIRELKARLSEELAAVGRGEVILVTDRGRLVAELRAPGSTGVARFPDARLEAWLRGGRARIDDAGTPESYPPSPVELPPGTAQRRLDEARAEG